eukprot:762826-Hanusia_phi.AAC.2
MNSSPVPFQSQTCTWTGMLRTLLPDGDLMSRISGSMNTNVSFHLGFLFSLITLVRTDFSSTLYNFPLTFTMPPTMNTAYGSLDPSLFMLTSATSKFRAFNKLRVTQQNR